MVNKKYLFPTAFSISFLGSIPIGTLNASVANYAINNNVRGAALFGIGAILIELILVRFAFFILDKLAHLRKLFKILGTFMTIGLLILAYKTLESAFYMRNFQDSIPFISQQAFYSGIFLSMLNPLHLPYWLGWIAILERRGILDYNLKNYTIFIVAIGLGTGFSFIIYGFAGQFLMNTLKSYHNLINWIIGFTLLFTGLFQTYKISKTFFKRKVSSQMQSNP